MVLNARRRPSAAKWDEDRFFVRRRELLATWPTGAEADLDEAVAYHRTLPATKNVAKVLAQARREGRTLMHPRAGVALLDEHVELLRALQDEGGADLLPSTVDSYTRHGRYAEAARAIAESRPGDSKLNGFPVVNYGVAGARRVVESVDRPLQIRTVAERLGLAQEIAWAGGYSAATFGFVCITLGYSKDVNLTIALEDWQYLARLGGYYTERGVPISAAIYSPLTTLLPPCLNNAATILDALISAHQGMRAFSLGCSQQANVVQDVAALHSLLEVGEEYLAKLGFDDVSVVATLYQWMNNFPADEARAMGVICLGAATAALAGAHQVIVKTPHEAWGVPTREANLAGLKATKQVLSMLRNQRWPETEEYRQERAQISRETRAILDRVLELGDGDVAVGTLRGIESGVVEICFSPHRLNAGRALGMNDAQGAVRFLDCGNLPFDAEIREYHREKVEARVKDAGRPSYELMLDDVYAVSDAIAG